jgi:anhydro-N-acetylmuramic acid kinase
LHGQTVFHNPDLKAPATLQIGEGAYLAEMLRVPVVSNFRAADLAAGGQGAPLATAFHVRVFGRRGRHVCVNNLGGISNVTSIDWRRGVAPKVLAFDTGPANVLLDLAMGQFTNGRRSLDRDGAWSARGRVCQPLLAEWLEHPYFRRPPPKSTGRELFGERFLVDALAAARRRRLSKFDLVATLTEFTARSLAMNYRAHLPNAPDSVVLAGGGAANPALREGIAAALHETRLETSVCMSADLGWPLQSIEPAAFAYLAWLRQRGQPGNLPETTGAERAVMCGVVQ